jgi:hypothetical protein
MDSSELRAGAQKQTLVLGQNNTVFNDIGIDRSSALAVSSIGDLILAGNLQPALSARRILAKN